MEEKDPLVVDPLEKVMLDGSKKFTYISSLLSDEEREQLRLVLLNNIDVFARSHSDMVGINSTVASHKLRGVYSISTFNDFYRLFLSDRLSWILMDLYRVHKSMTDFYRLLF